MPADEVAPALDAPILWFDFGIRDDGLVSGVPVNAVRDILNEGIGNDDVGV